MLYGPAQHHPQALESSQPLPDQRPLLARGTAGHTPASINHILKSLQKQAGLNQIGELSGNSFRVGAALDLLNKNILLEKIMLRGGWKSETSAMRYLQSWNDSNWLIFN
jgi:hypothetical protein